MSRLSRWLVVLSGTILYLGFYSCVPLLPALDRMFGVAPGSTSWGMCLPFLVMVLLIPVAPRLPLAAGRLLGAGLLFVGLVGLLAAAAPTMGLWLTARMFQGAGAAAVPGLAMALIPVLFPERPLDIAGMWVAGNVLGGGLGRSLGGFLGQLVGERWALALTALPALLPGLWLLRERESASLPPARYSLEGWQLYYIGFAVLFINFFNANLLPYRLEALGLNHAQIGAVMLAYLAGIPSGMLVGPLCRRMGQVAGMRLAFTVAGTGMAVQLVNSVAAIASGFTLIILGLFMAQGIGGGASGQRGSGASASYVAAFYLGGTVAGLVYPLFLHLRPVYAAALVWTASLAAMFLARPALAPSRRCPLLPPTL